MQDELTLTLNSPITEEQWDGIMDVDFDHTDRIMFHTKHGREVEFVKRKKGKWNTYVHGDADFSYSCNMCGYGAPFQFIGGKASQKKWSFCPHCGADMRGGQDEWVLRG